MNWSRAEALGLLNTWAIDKTSLRIVVEGDGVATDAKGRVELPSSTELKLVLDVAWGSCEITFSLAEVEGEVELFVYDEATSAPLETRSESQERFIRFLAIPRSFGIRCILYELWAEAFPPDMPIS